MVPDRIEPGLQPGGVVIRLYGVGNMVLVEQYAPLDTTDAVLESLAGRAAEVAAESGRTHGVVTLAGYDGDSGELMMAYEGDFS